MAHAQKPDFVFRAKRTSPFKSAGALCQSTAGSGSVRISGNNAGYTMFRGSVKGTGYPLHSPVSPSLPLTCVTECHHVSTGLYHKTYSARDWLSILRTPYPTQNHRRNHRTELHMTRAKISVYTGLFEMTVGDLTTCHTQYTWDRSICIFLFNGKHSKFLLHTL